MEGHKLQGGKWGKEKGHVIAGEKEKYLINARDPKKKKKVYMKWEIQAATWHCSVHPSLSLGRKSSAGVCVYLHTHTHIYKCIDIPRHLYMYAYAYIHIYTYIHVYDYICMTTYTIHTCMLYTYTCCQQITYSFLLSFLHRIIVWTNSVCGKHVETKLSLAHIKFDITISY